MTKLYASKVFLSKRYLRERKSIEEIAAECGVTPMTVYRYLNKFGLKR